MENVGIGRKFLSYVTSAFKKAPVAPQIVQPRSVNVSNMFRKHIGLSADTFERLAVHSEGQIVGNLPEDILKAIKAKRGDRSILIKKVQNGFKAAADELSNFSKREIEKLDFIINNPQELAKATNEFIRTKAYSPDISDEFMQSQRLALKSLIKGMKKILPFGTRIQVQHIGSGQMGNAYMFNFIDIKGQKVFKDLVIKTYKSTDEIVKLMALRQLLSQKMYAQMSDKELKLFLEKHFAKHITSEQEIERLVSNEFSQIRQKGVQTLQELEAEIRPGIIKKRKYHGGLAEANATEYIRNLTGHKIDSDTNYVLPNMFVTGKNSFSISRYVPSDMKAPTKILNTMNIGLRHGDAITINPANSVAGRVIDMGGISEVWCKELDNRVSVKYFKKIADRNSLSETMSAIERYRQEAMRTQDLTLREKILKAVNLAEQLINQSHS